MINVCDVGKRIKELRISSNLTQDKIAEYLSLIKHDCQNGKR